MAEMLGALDGGCRGSVIQVAGEPGIGKSRLLRELGEAAEAREYLVFSGRAAEFDAELPFGVMADALDDWLAAVEPERLERLAAGRAAELSTVLSAFDSLAQPHPPELQQERLRAYRAVRALLSTLAADAPVVLVLDDVQWADPGSIELLSHLLAHPPRGRVLLALGFRPAQVQPRLRTALASALREGDSQRLDLSPLNALEARILLGPEVQGATLKRLFRESGGNPFFLQQLARGVTLSGQHAAGSDEIERSVPGPVRAALATELSALSAPSLVLLQGAAVTGDPFEAGLAARAADLGDADALDLLDELLRFQLVTPTAVAGEFAFRHPIVRATVSELTASGWQARAHARLAAVLAARGANATARAPHVMRSAVMGDGGAIDLLVEAGHSSASRAPAMAARWYAAALGLLPVGKEMEARRIELLIATATALVGAGQLEEGRTMLSDILERLPDRHPARVPVVAFCANVEHLLGRHRDAGERLATALAAISDGSSVEAVVLKIELSAGAGFQNRSEDMLTWAEQAFTDATTLGMRPLAAVAAGQVALASYFLGRPADVAMDRAAASIDALDDAELASRLDLGLWVGWSEAVLERYLPAIEHCQRVIRVARATGQGATLLVTMTAQAWALIRLGRLDEAEELLTGAIEAGRLAPNLFLSVAVGLWGSVATCKGDYEAAIRAGEESVRLARSADPGLIPGMSGLYLALPLIETGQARAAHDAILAMSGGDPDLQTSRSGHAMAYEILTRAELALGNTAAAEAWAGRAEAATHGGALVAEGTFAQRAMAAVALAGRDAPGAARRALDAAVRADDAGVPVEAGRCRILAAQALMGVGDRAGAIAALEHASRHLRHLGAEGYCAEADRALRRLGRRPGRRPAAPVAVVEQVPLTRREKELAESANGWEALTPSEQAVVGLVAEGLSNPAVAERLYLSRHTVKRHLSNAMVKLHVSSRRELWALARPPHQE